MVPRLVSHPITRKPGLRRSRPALGLWCWQSHRGKLIVLLLGLLGWGWFAPWLGIALRRPAPITTPRALSPRAAWIPATVKLWGDGLPWQLVTDWGQALHSTIIALTQQYSFPVLGLLLVGMLVWAMACRRYPSLSQLTQCKTTKPRTKRKTP